MKVQVKIINGSQVTTHVIEREHYRVESGVLILKTEDETALYISLSQVDRVEVREYSETQTQNPKGK